jgi:hypothetical protein
MTLPERKVLGSAAGVVREGEPLVSPPTAVVGLDLDVFLEDATVKSVNIESSI